LPSTLPGGRVRHELPEALTNRILCRVLEQFAIHASSMSGFSSDPVVEYAGEHFRLTGTLLDGSLFDLYNYTPRFHIEGGLLRPAAPPNRPGGRWNTDDLVPPVSALEHVSYLLAWQARAIREALPV